MARLSRAEAQERNRARVLAAARAEFAERGFRDAKVDAIAERAELTRGAVYSNFPGKRALYFAVLADLVERAPGPAHPQHGTTPAEALGALARAWVSRLDAEPGGWARLAGDLLPEVVSAELTRRPFEQLMALDALLLGLALERLRPPAREPGGPVPRRVRLATTVLGALHGASGLAGAAPGFLQPFDVISACERLAGLELNDHWPPPTAVPPVRAADLPWSPPSAVDLVTGGPARLDGDGVVAVLGLHRLAAVEQAVRAGAEVTAVLVTGEPAELAPLARLVVAELCGCLRQSFPPSAWPRLRVVCDESGAVAAAAGVAAVSDATEAAVRVESGRVVARAEGFGACQAVASGSVVAAG
ncbi:TetR/AcrR family transcriptional regulator [Saccharothrix coeruleofusca]|uniref:TetR family transcriptional regulator n=1 Tax=Saccharothrix coeruleofusca TaxID=33919 RepID=A0A918EGA3_9PSEU|nr:TetR/AcrR family transcriptional regulator [Saccharothrix coeruleofusca]MBP2337093.1 AcrR family transcriptional regulator [Saccharothrix coeruleofusca]GGP67200.1 TetR family transcriptional regulator [Saccharothrix coeruleofusca]